MQSETDAVPVNTITVKMEEAKPYLVAFLVNCIYTGMSIISKLAFTHGMNAFVFVFYRLALATFLLAPFAVHGRKRAPPLSFGILVKIFVLAFFGITLSLDLFNAGLNYTTPTVVSAIANSLPVITFFIAVLLRMEYFKLQSFTGAIKLMAIALCLAGVATMSFYNGPMLEPMIQNTHRSQVDDICTKDKRSWFKGTTLVSFSNVTWSLWIVMQGKFLVDYPSKLQLTTLQCMFGTMQSFIVAIIFERDLSKWKLRFDVDLIAITYCGIMVTGIGCYLQVWVIEKKGPVFLAAFTPLNLVMTILITIFFLNEAIGLGSVLGGVLLIGCLYIFLWGKHKEKPQTCQPIIKNDEREEV